MVGVALTAALATASAIAQTSGAGWAPLGGGIAGEVRALVLAGDGTLYAGQALPAGVWAWNGAVWGRLGPGDTGSVYAVALAPDAPMPGAGRVYAGGIFNSADGQPVSNVAAFDPANPDAGWDDLGGGLSGPSGVTAFAFGPDGRLYAASPVGPVGGIETDIAAWDGTAWSAVGPPFAGGFWTLAFSDDGKLYAGGLFDLPDGSRNVARLDGYLGGPGAGTWVGLGGGVTQTDADAAVRALAVGPEGEVYVGGLFDRVWEGGTSMPAANVAVWLGDRVVGAEAPVEARALALSVRPNPSRGAATVSVTLAEASAVRVVVVDVLGRVVAVVHDGALSAGTHALAVDVSRLPAGVYAVRVAGDGASSSARLTVVR